MGGTAGAAAAVPAAAPAGDPSLVYPLPRPLPVTPEIAKKTLFGKIDKGNPASVAAHNLPDIAIRLIFQLSDEERKAYDLRCRTGWSTNILCLEYKIVGLFATNYNILPILTPNPPASPQGPADKGAANVLHGNYPPDNKGALSHLFLDKNGEATSKTYDLIVSACESMGDNLSEFVHVFSDRFLGVVPTRARNRKQFTPKQHLESFAFREIREAVNELNAARFTFFKESGFSSANVLLFGQGKEDKEALKKAAQKANLSITFIEVGHPSALAICRPNIKKDFANTLDKGFANWLGKKTEVTFFR